MFSRIAFARFSSASPIRGKATFASTNIVTPNRISVQIISPRPGRDQEAAALVLGAERAATVAIVAEQLHRGLEEEGDQAEDERVEGDRLGQREAEPADRLQLVLHLGLAGDRLDLLAEDDPDADAGADRAEPGADAERDRLAGRP